MAVYFNSNMRFVVDGGSLAGFAKQIDLDTQVQVLNATTLADGGWNVPIAGIESYSLKLQGFQDFSASGPDALFPSTSSGGPHVFTLVPQTTAANGDEAFFGTARRVTKAPLMGNVGDIAGWQFDWSGVGHLVNGQVIHPSAARTSSSTGSAVAFTAPTASQTLWAVFQVTAVSGTGTITFTIQTDDNSGFTTPTTRITSTAIAAVGAQVGSLAGSLSGETYVRVGWTISGFTSVTFEVAAGVANTLT